jgi:membrane protein implicated in regulation of membrane protease activity
MELNYWWIWMILAALFVIGEIFTAGFFLLWFGIGAAVAGLVALFGFGMITQLSVFVVLSLVLFAVSRKFADRFSNEQPPGIGANRFIGMEGIVLQPVDNIQSTGRVRMSREEWRAESESGERLEEGQRVVVTRINGTHLVVKPIQEGE